MSILKTIVRQCLQISLLVSTASLLSAQTGPTREYQIKAVFLFNFAQFVEWPEHAFPEAGAPLIIGVLGADPFGSYLDETVRGEKINGHPLIIHRYRDVTQVKGCHILFINPEKTVQLKQVFASLKEHNILAVGDESNFIQQGGMIRFLTENSKTRIQINLDATKEADLKISSKLLRLAEIVTPKK